MGPSLPHLDLTVQAWIDAQLCGQADRHVQVTLNGQPLSPGVQRDNSAVWQIDLIPAAIRHIYLPIVLK